ncbi:ribonuclease E/G [Futiania mangrovi]|uniref:Ribonuclease E/G n=1 Tax=Futiania mangrovi TaxID=2959716 RepID=A0A9J6PJI4_9PROT|nr:ribonuclease E/G [Futiania mangrovii]MCP1337939.1 ribonuclease E/G [Futiania mangrovii]
MRGNELLIESGPGEVRIARVAGGRLTELVHDRAVRWPARGAVLPARISQAAPALDGHFVALGRGVTGFLPAKELARGARAPAVGDRLTLQVTREAVNGKGPRLTARIALAGPRVVYRPHGRGHGLSRALGGTPAEARLARLAGGAPVPGGLIFRRTAGNADEGHLLHEIEALAALWSGIAREDEAPLAAEYEILRHLAEVETVAADDTTLGNRLARIAETVAPDLAPRIETAAATSVFDRHDTAGQIAAALEPRVALPSGGNLVIEETEALVAVDVNAGRGEADPVRTAARTNAEAVEALAREMRLRALGGPIVVDVIEAQGDAVRARLDQEMRAATRDDPARVDVLPPSRLGLMEMVRTRLGPSLKTLYTAPDARPAPSVEAAALGAARLAAREAKGLKFPAAVLRVAPAVAHWLGQQADLRADLDARAGRPVRIVADPGLSPATALVERAAGA